ncbi:MAG: efflux RND transporter periplasmic adaptor subunit [Alphaproteobacteria bacterium]
MSKSILRQLVLVLVVLGLGAAGYRYGLPLISAGEAAKPQQSRPAPRVVALEVDFKPEVIRFEAVGTAQALRSVMLHPASAGEVTEVNIAAGSKVAKGDLLVRLDQRNQVLARRLAAVKVKNAEQLLRRYEKTAGSGAVPENTVEAARNALAEARIALDQATVALADRQVTAPFAGIVGITDVEVGQRIDPDDPIASLDDRAALLIWFDIPEALIARINVGQPIQVATWAERDVALQGEIVDIGSRIDPATRAFRARARLDNADDRLRPGMSFAVRQTIAGQRYPAVPEVAVQWGGDGAFLWVIRDGKARRVPVTIVQRQGGEVLVAAELAEAELVVIEGVQKMREGREAEHTLAENTG